MKERSNIKPIFVFSLPRSGSTLLQRVLACSPEINTASEPWLLLPFLYALREEGTHAEYGHLFAYWGIKEFVDTLPQGSKTYEDALKNMVLSLYASSSSKKQGKYFLDKTPRYHSISSDIIQLFKLEGKFVFLWRHPLAVAASILNTWGKKGWNLYLHKVDLYQGLDAMVKSFEKNHEQSFSVRYEDLVGPSSKQYWETLFTYLGVEFNDSYLSGFSDVILNGVVMGDKSGVARYKKIDNSSVKVWKATFKNPLRKRWAVNYLKWLGKDRLGIMGYNFDELMSELDSLPTGWSNLAQDTLLMGYGELRCLLSLRVIWGKFLKARRFHDVINEEY